MFTLSLPLAVAGHGGRVVLFRAIVPFLRQRLLRGRGSRGKPVSVIQGGIPPLLRPVLHWSLTPPAPGASRLNALWLLPLACAVIVPAVSAPDSRFLVSRHARRRLARRHRRAVQFVTPSGQGSRWSPSRFANSRPGNPHVFYNVARRRRAPTSATVLVVLDHWELRSPASMTGFATLRRLPRCPISSALPNGRRSRRRSVVCITPLSPGKRLAAG